MQDQWSFLDDEGVGWTALWKRSNDLKTSFKMWWIPIEIEMERSQLECIPIQSMQQIETSDRYSREQQWII